MLNAASEADLLVKLGQKITANLVTRIDGRLMQAQTKKILLGASFGLLASLIWGSWPVISKMSTLEQLDHWDITAIRFLVAGCLLLPILLLQFAKSKKLLAKGLVLALGAGAPYVLLATSGLNLAPSSHFGIIAPSSMLLFTTLGCVFFLSEKISTARLLGVAMIFTGVVSVGVGNLGALSLDTAVGDLMFVGCGLLWASYTLLCKYWKIDAWMATALVSVLSMLIYTPIYLLHSPGALGKIPLQTLLQQGLFQGVLVAILALYCYSQAVAILGSSRGAVFAALVPPTTMFLAVILLAEMITWVEQFGLLAVSFGIVLALGLVKKVPFVKTA